MRIIIFMMCLLPASAFAFDDEDIDRDALVEEYIVLSGFDTIFEDVPDQLRARLQERLSSSADPVLEKKYAARLVESLDVSAMRKRVADHLHEHADTGYLEGMIEWYNSPLGKKVTAAELESGLSENRQAMAAYVQQLQVDKPRRSRTEMLIRIEALADASGMMTEFLGIVLKTTESLQNTVEGGNSGTDRFDKEFESVRDELREKLRRELVLKSYYTYRDIEDKELFELIRFYQTSLGTRMFELTYAIYIEIMGDWFASALEYVSEEIRKEKALKSSPAHST